jgi:hypothetical protein
MGLLARSERSHGDGGSIAVEAAGGLTKPEMMATRAYGKTDKGRIEKVPEPD